MQDFLHCKTISEKPVIVDDEYVYYSCPRNWITDNVNDFLGVYFYDQKFYTARDYEDQSCRYLDAYRVYEYEYSEAQKRKPGKR
jgi:hypothetical protein